MRGVVTASVPVCYVRELDKSRAFYELFGLSELRSGGDGEARWSYLQCGELTVLVAEVHPPLIPVELPLLMYLYVDDVAAVTRRLQQAGRAVDLVGYPDHAPGGEARTLDPDGNTVLFGQRAAIPEEDRVAPTAERARFSLIRQAAEAVSRRGGAPSHCQIGGPGDEQCTEPADVKLADPWGETVWGCMNHVDEVLISARSAFIATEDAHGLGPYLQSRRARRSPPEKG
jgi:catechol 2,3-dioxygenase-like lactoylglutathione lyase family enzyme